MWFAFDERHCQRHHEFWTSLSDIPVSTVIHVTHEAVTKSGGIGTVLEGLITAPAYQRNVARTVLVGPLFSSLDEDQIRRTGEILYSSQSAVTAGDYAVLFGAIVAKYGVDVVYGRRQVDDAGSGRGVMAEVILVDCSHMSPELENAFKFRLYEEFGLQSERYESVWDFTQYLRLAEPAYDALVGLLDQEEGPHFVISHEYMGMPLALKAIIAGDRRFRTIFHAHEVATMRPLVEESPGHDAMFYNVLDQATAADMTVADAFGDQSGFYRHVLVSCARHCDAIFAVGDCVERELRFMSREFLAAPIDVVYNGVPAARISLEQRKRSIAGLQAYGEGLTGSVPDFIFTHVTRLVPSKGLWRDFQVLEHLDLLLSKDGHSGTFFILTSTAGSRSPDDVDRMEAEYGWPAQHRLGYPDLDGQEVELWEMVDAFNQRSQSIQAILVNQFGWSRALCGRRMSEEMTFMDLRRGTHVEFGQSIYEPFGIAQLEPLSFGALCVLSSVCGCVGFVDQVTGSSGCENVLVADYTNLPAPLEMPQLLSMDAAARLEIEGRCSLGVAGELHRWLPRTDADLEMALTKGFEVAGKMSWDSVARDLFVPGLERAAQVPA